MHAFAYVHALNALAEGCIVCATGVHPVRLWTREDVRSSFVSHPNLEALTTEWVQDHARKIEVAKGEEVQVQPKGGWWRRTVGEMREHHIHIVRTIMGMQYEHVPSGAEALQLVLRGPMLSGTYDRLAAVAASLFVQMACRERGPSGRARRSGVAPPTMAAFAAAGVRVPRYVVGLMMQPSLSKTASSRLVDVERVRIIARAPVVHIVSQGVLPNGSYAYLARLDLGGMRWLPEPVLQQTAVGSKALEVGHR